MPSKRRLLKGTTISSGIVLGRTRTIAPGVHQVSAIPVPLARLPKEISDLSVAISKTTVELEGLMESAGKKMGGAVAKIFDAQLMIANDQEFLKIVESSIRKERLNAAFVYHREVQKAIMPLISSDDSYMRQMATDIEAVSSRVISFLKGSEQSALKFAPNTIVVGKSFTPGEILSFRQRKATGFIVSEGGKNSHMALIARSLMLPVIMLPSAWTIIPDSSPIIVDGTTGELIINGTDEEFTEFQKQKKKHGPSSLSRIKKISKFPPTTKDGQTVGIAANLSLPGPADSLLAEKKIPVGLYRTEFLYLTHNGFPDETAQFEYYLQLAQLFGETEIILRTFDLGYDKRTNHSIWPEEENPALGWRGIRPMLEMTDIFKTQIRAILRASASGSFKIMLPMISDCQELVSAKKLIGEVKNELRKQKTLFDEQIKIGIMVEVPSAAILADRLAVESDFMSIGTNDLTQYTVAADRVNQKVAKLYNSFHPAVLSLVQMTVQACKKANIPVAVCGEVAGDPLALPLLIGMGIDTLSINPNRVVDMVRLTEKVDAESARALARSVLSCENSDQVLARLNKYSRALGKKKI